MIDRNRPSAYGRSGFNKALPMTDRTSPPRSFQEILMRLQAYWGARGCAVLQPYDMEVGAGTFHPATTLRALGSRPWAAAYVQPSRRPTDGRYGENPNRLQHYYQYQVLIKPSPPDRRALWREPEPPSALLPVPGPHQTVPARPAGALSRLAPGDRH